MSLLYFTDKTLAKMKGIDTPCNKPKPKKAKSKYELLDEILRYAFTERTSEKVKKFETFARRYTL